MSEAEPDQAPRVKSFIPEDAPGVTTPEGAPPSDSPAVCAAVRQALEDDSRVNHHLIEVKAEGDTIYLSGRQDTVDACDAAIEAASNAAGAGNVVSDLEVRPSI